MWSRRCLGGTGASRLETWTLQSCPKNSPLRPLAPQEGAGWTPCLHHCPMRAESPPGSGSRSLPPGPRPQGRSQQAELHRGSQSAPPQLWSRQPLWRAPALLWPDAVAPHMPTRAAGSTVFPLQRTAECEEWALLSPTLPQAFGRGQADEATPRPRARVSTRREAPRGAVALCCLCFCHVDLFLNRHFSDIQCPWCGVGPGGASAQAAATHPLWRKNRREASWRPRPSLWE